MRRAQAEREAHPPPNTGLGPVLTPRRRLRRPSGLSSGSVPGLRASPEMPGSLVESFWGGAGWEGKGGVGIKAPGFCPGLLPTSPCTQALTSELQRDRKGIREFEGLVSAKREHRSQGVGPLAQPQHLFLGSWGLAGASVSTSVRWGHDGRLW